MQLLKERILKDGVVKPGNVLKVDSFLNHQMDIDLINEIGKEFRRRFPSEKITKILTIEASGIGIACIAGTVFPCSGCFCEKGTEHQYRRRSLPFQGRVFHTQTYLRRDSLQEVPRTGRSCSDHRRFSGKRMRPSRADLHRQGCTGYH